MAKAGNEAYCTLLTNDEYLPGVLVLAHSLRDNGTKKELAILVTLDTVSATSVHELKKLYDQIIPVDRIVNKSPANLYLMDRPDLGSSFTKIALWRQLQFSHLVYVDADVVSLRAPDELFNLPHSFAAVPDIGWPDCFNSGILSLKPNMGDYYALLALAQRGISFDGADQGLLNMHFRNWERLSFAYNCTPSGNYQYVPAYRHFQSSISMVHYIGKDKPWIAGREQHSRATGVYEELIGRWWAVYDKHYRVSSQDPRQSSNQSRTVQQYVTGESTSAGYGYHPTIVEPIVEPTEEAEHVPEESMSEEREPTEEIKPTPTAQQRRFSIDWDPTRQAPPAQSRPEAPDFPSRHYDMSHDSKLFQAPRPPSPPKDLGYELPKPQPKPIFPWEDRAPKPTRVFAEDLPPPPAPAAMPEATPSEATESSTEVESQATASEADTITPSSPPFTAGQPFANFTTANAWDSVPEINRYISSLPQNRRGKVQVLLNKSTPLSSPPSGSDPSDPILSPTSERPPDRDRRPSKVTDFPTEIERPSLPVTPAPVQRPSFWGAERDEQGDLPPAEGVPEQNEWDPMMRLLQLRERQSDLLHNAPAEGEAREIPNRDLVESAASLKPGQAAELAKLADSKILDRSEKVTGAAPATSDLAAGVLREGATTDADTATVPKGATEQAATRSEGGDAGLGGRAKDIAEAMKAEPDEDALKGPAPMTAAATATETPAQAA